MMCLWSKRRRLDKFEELPQEPEEECFVCGLKKYARALYDIVKGEYSGKYFRMYVCERCYVFSPKLCKKAKKAKEKNIEW